MIKKTYKIEDMHCINCKNKIDKAVSSLKKVEFFNTDLENKTLEVEFDEKKIKEDKIIKAVTKAGFTINIDNTKEFVVNGMMCNHCKMTVEKVSKVKNVTDAVVDLENKSLKIKFKKNVDVDKIVQNIQDEGFEVEGFEKKKK